MSGYQVRETDDFQDIHEAFVTLMNRLNDYLKKKEKMPKIYHPVVHNKDFNRDWTQEQYSNFRDKINLYTGKVNDATDAIDHNTGINKN